MSHERPPLHRFQLATLKAAAWLLSIGLSFAASAAPREPGEGCRDMPAAGAMHQPRIAELRKDLALDAKQEAQWTAALDTTQKLYKELIDSRRASHDKMKSTLDAQAPDLRALAEQADRDRETEQAKRKQAREAWLKFYDDLKPEQKQKASRFLLDQIGMLGDGHPHALHGGPGPMRGDGPPPDAPRSGRKP
jgi:Spy/CpxP family protein refolding chaperone